MRYLACVTVRSAWAFDLCCRGELSLFERRTFSSFCSLHPLLFWAHFWLPEVFRSLGVSSLPLPCSLRASSGFALFSIFLLFRLCRKRVPISAILAQICGCERFFVSLMGFSERLDTCRASDLVFCRAPFAFRKNHRSQPQNCAKTRRKRTCS